MEKTMRVEIDGLGGTEETIVAECKSMRAAWFLANIVYLSSNSYKSIKIIDSDNIVAEDWRYEG
jgi:hypothetical protein